MRQNRHDVKRKQRKLGFGFIFGYLGKLLCLPSEDSVKFLENFSKCSKNVLKNLPMTKAYTTAHAGSQAQASKQARLTVDEIRATTYTEAEHSSRLHLVG